MNAQELSQIGPYAVRRYIAEGGMAWVFEVLDSRFPGREVIVALKLLKPEAAVGDELLRFQNEAGLQAQIDHPNLIRVLDFGQDAETQLFYYTMPYLDGGTLADRLHEGPIEIEEAGRILLGVLDGLQELHRRGVTHRDIKPANILFGSDGRPRLADLGIAHEQDRRITRTNTAVGTVIYMSPEQARAREVKITSDVFAVGLTLYEALTGSIVYDDVEGIDSTSSHDVLGYLVSLARTGEEIEIDFARHPSVPAALAEVVERACRFEPSERYADAAAMRDALAEALREPLPEPTRAPIGKLPLAIGAGVLAALLLAAGVWWWMAAAGTQAALEAAERAAEELDKTVLSILDRTAELDPAQRPPEELLAEARDDFERAGEYLADARADAKQRSAEIALTSFERAQQRFREVSSLLVAEFLAARAEALAERSRARVAGLEQAGASEHLPEPWAALQQRLAEIAAPGAEAAPEAVAAAQLRNIESALAVEDAAAQIERDLREVWPLLAQKALNGAQEAQAIAQGATVDVAPYRSAIERGEAALAQGSEASAQEDHLAARDRYAEAKEAFDTAAAIVPAARARTEVYRILEETPGLDPEETIRVISRADGQFDRGDWKPATDNYELAARQLRGQWDEQERKLAAERVADSASVARELAIKEGAESSASAELARADTARDAGQQALAAGSYDGAQKSFEQAEGLYTEARNTAIKALADVRNLLADARRAGEQIGSCQQAFESDTARGQCEGGVGDLARCSQAVESLDASAALLACNASIAALDAARRAEEQFLGSKLWPPEIVSRTPRDDLQEVFRNQRKTFAVEARDQNERDVLDYRWTFDGQPLPERAAEIAFAPTASGRLVAVVSDGTGRSARTEWEIALGNRAPKLAPSPSGGRVNLSTGDRKVFRASAEDPDRDRVTSRFLLDGREVSRDESYAFASDAPGSHKLVFEATDEAGARSAHTWEIRVAAVARNQRPSLRVEPSGTVELPAGRSQRFEAHPSDPDGDSVSVSFLLDGRSVASGSSYTFVAKGPGRHTLAIVADDGRGGTRRLERTVVVAAAPSRDTPEGRVQATLDRFIDSLNRKDMRALESTWPHFDRSKYKIIIEAWLKAETRFALGEVGRPNISGDEARLVFEMSRTTSRGTRPGKYELTLFERSSTREWQIQELNRAN